MSTQGAGAMLLPVLLILNWALASGKADNSCSALKHLENGRTFFRYSGLYVTFSCNPGFKIYGYRTSSCVSGQWAREPPLCLASGCPRPAKLLHGTASMSPDGSLVRFTCDSGFRLFGSPMLYCRGKSWNGSTPVCKESDIMGSFQFKHTSWSKPGLASTGGEEMFRKPLFTGRLLKDPQRPMDTTQDGNRTVTRLETLSGSINGDPTKTVDPIDQKQLANTFPIAQLTLDNLSSYAKPSESTILVTSSTNDHLKNVSALFQMSPLHKAADKKNDHPTSSRQTHEDPVTLRSSPSSATDSPQNTSIMDTPAGPFEIPKEGGLSENFSGDISQPSDVSIKISTSVYPTSIPDPQESKNKTSSSITIEDFEEDIVPFDPAKINDEGHFLATGPYEDLVSGTEIPTSSILTLRMMTSPDVPTEAPRMGHQANGETEFLVRQTSGLTDRTSLITNDGLKTVNQSVLNQTPKVLNTSEISHSSSVQTRRQRTVCPYPPVPSHGTFYFRTIANPAPFQYKHYVQFACYAGYTLAKGDLYSFCLLDGTWSGVTPKCVELTPCSLNHGGCSQVCQVNEQDQAECLCKPGFLLLEDRRTCRDLNECAEGLHGCQQVCENTFGSYRCRCTPGFQLSADGVSCTDVDECLLPTISVHCAFGCINTPGSFHCRCPSGYTVNITTGHCTDVDECMEDGRREPCAHTCVNTPGSFYCTCSNGFQLGGDGRACVPECPPGYHKRYDAPEGNSTTPHCVDIDECMEMTERKQDQQHRCAWRCVNLPGTHHCICPRGFILHPNKYLCKDIDECVVRNGGCLHICVNYQGGYKCTCPEDHRPSPYDRRKCWPVQNAQNTSVISKYMYIH